MGVIIHEYRISPAAAMIQENDGIAGIARERVNLLLAVLPKGTAYVGGQTGAIVDLSIPVIMRFEHPALPDGTRIETEHYRVANVVDDGTPNARIEQASLLTEIIYFKPDGTRMFQRP